MKCHVCEDRESIVAHTLPPVARRDPYWVAVNRTPAHNRSKNILPKKSYVKMLHKIKMTSQKRMEWYEDVEADSRGQECMKHSPERMVHILSIALHYINYAISRHLSLSAQWI